MALDTTRHYLARKSQLSIGVERTATKAAFASVYPTEEEWQRQVDFLVNAGCRVSDLDAIDAERAAAKQAMLERMRAFKNGK